MICKFSCSGPNTVPKSMKRRKCNTFERSYKSGVNLGQDIVSSIIEKNIMDRVDQPMGVP